MKVKDFLEQQSELMQSHGWISVADADPCQWHRPTMWWVDHQSHVARQCCMIMNDWVEKNGLRLGL